MPLFDCCANITTACTSRPHKTLVRDVDVRHSVPRPPGGRQCPALNVLRPLGVDTGEPKSPSEQKMAETEASGLQASTPTNDQNQHIFSAISKGRTYVAIWLAKTNDGRCVLCNNSLFVRRTVHVVHERNHREKPPHIFLHHMKDRTTPSTPCPVW